MNLVLHRLAALFFGLVLSAPSAECQTQIQTQHALPLARLADSHQQSVVDPGGSTPSSMRFTLGVFKTPTGTGWGI
jgi:hypothetical protein